MKTLTIQQARLIDPRHGQDTVTDIHLAEGKVCGIGKTPSGFKAEEIVPAHGLIACPGLVDLSARLPVLEAELRAAVAGGVTTLVSPPDIRPTLDEAENVERLTHNAAKVGLARLLPLGALTLGLKGERLSELLALRKAGCIAFSQGRFPVQDTEVLLRAFEYAATFNLPVWLHPRDFHLGRHGIAHDGEVATRLGLAGIPIAAETVAIATALALAAQTGVRLHFQRISAAASCALIAEAQRQGQTVTCDIAIHHLHGTEDALNFFDSQARFDPPLRSAEDQAALRKAAQQGLAVLCSDHTPLGNDDKWLPFPDALPGATALELLLPLTLQWAAETGVSLRDALACLTDGPAHVLGAAFEDSGHLGVGARADLCLFDPDSTWTVTPESLQSTGKHSPLMGKTLKGQVVQTFSGGRTVFKRDCPHQ